MPAPVTKLRPVGDCDADFLRDLFLASRPELRVLATAPAGAGLVDLQVAAQRAQYEAEHPHSRDHVVVADGRRAGRCWTSESSRELRVLDLAVHPAHRRRGIARAVLAAVCRRARDARVPVRLSVWHDNVAARRLYDTAGFRPTGDAGGYVSLQWTSDGVEEGGHLS